MISLQDIDILSLRSSLRLSADAKGGTTVFDPLRKNYFPATPEEIVRQLWILYFLDHLLLSKKLIAVERAFQHNGFFTRRFDLVVFGRDTKPFLLAEFKGPGIRITQSTFDQIARYNMELHVPYSLVSNGHQHFCFQIDDENRRFVWLENMSAIFL